MSGPKRERQHMNANRFHRGLPGRVKAVDDTKATETGFTLIELLVVIASIAILAVTLLPGFAGTRQNSQVIGCLANQRQLAAAWMMYAGDHHDYLVPNRGLDNQDPNLNQFDPRTDSGLQPGGQYSDWCPGNLAGGHMCSCVILCGFRPGCSIRISKILMFTAARQTIPLFPEPHLYRCECPPGAPIR